MSGAKLNKYGQLCNLLFNLGMYGELSHGRCFCTFLGNFIRAFSLKTQLKIEFFMLFGGGYLNKPRGNYAAIRFFNLNKQGLFLTGQFIQELRSDHFA